MYPRRSRRERRARLETEKGRDEKENLHPSASPASNAPRLEDGGDRTETRRRASARPPARPVDGTPSPTTLARATGRECSTAVSRAAAPRAVCPAAAALGPSKDDSSAHCSRANRRRVAGHPDSERRPLPAAAQSPSAASRTLTRLHPEGYGGSHRPGTPKSLLGDASANHASTPRAGPPERQPRARATTASTPERRGLARAVLRRRSRARPQDSTSPPPRGR